MPRALNSSSASAFKSESIRMVMLVVVPAIVSTPFCFHLQYMSFAQRKQCFARIINTSFGIQHEVASLLCTGGQAALFCFGYTSSYPSLVWYAWRLVSSLGS